jgi:hypothetical protein
MLEELGGSADQVADALRAAGVVGVRNAVRILNPVVRYTYTKIKDAYGIDVYEGNAMRIVFADGREEQVALPEAVLRFLEAFNRGAYPDLEMPAPG